MPTSLIHAASLTRIFRSTLRSTRLNQVATRYFIVGGNLAKVDYSEANTPDESFTYEPDYNRMATMIDGIGTTGFVYHSNDGVTDGAGLIARINGAFPDNNYGLNFFINDSVIVNDEQSGINKDGFIVGLISVLPQQTYLVEFVDGSEETIESSLIAGVS